MSRALIIVFVLLQLAAVTLVAPAQEREITKPEFWEYFRLSRDATKDIPFRERVTVEMADLPTGPWEPYSSWMMENVYPDRSRTVYTSGRTGELMNIGTTSYRKELGGTWMSAEDKVVRVSPPASQFTFEPPIYFDLIGSEKAGEKFQIRVVSRARTGTDVDRERRSYIYSFDEKGVLISSEAIVFNGSKWLRRLELFEYDPSIKVHAPNK